MGKFMLLAAPARAQPAHQEAPLSEERLSAASNGAASLGAGSQGGVLKLIIICKILNLLGRSAENRADRLDGQAHGRSVVVLSRQNEAEAARALRIEQSW